MSIVYFIRHGKPAPPFDNYSGFKVKHLRGYNDTDFIKGLHESNPLILAEAFSSDPTLKEMKKINFQCMYYSPMQRAVESAALIEKSINVLRTEELELLREVIIPYDKYICDRTDEEIVSAGSVTKPFLADFLNGKGPEPLKLVIERIKRLQHNLIGDPIVCVSHGFFITIFRLYAENKKITRETIVESLKAMRFFYTYKYLKK